MSMSRDLVYSFAEELAKKAAKDGIPYNGRPIEPGSEDDDRLHGLLNTVEDDRVHAEAHKQRKRADEILENAGMDRRTAELMAGVMKAAAMGMDPYEVRDGQLVRKSDGRLMYCEKCPQ